jgi:ubiquitin-conjugating enzyme E2 M
LREDWKPVLDINAVIYGLIYLFYDPNPNDPLNRGERQRCPLPPARGAPPPPRAPAHVSHADAAHPPTPRRARHALPEAAELYRDDKRNFDRKVQQTLHGGYIDGQQYQRLI